MTGLSFTLLTRTSALPLLVMVAASAVAQTNFTILKSFDPLPDAAVPFCHLIEGTDGAMYGTTVAGGISNSGAVFVLRKDGSGYAVLKSFSGADGSGPYGDVVEGTNGALYGTTYGGGTSNFGTLFRLNKDGSDYRVLHNFLGGADGKNPWGALIKGTDAALYGSTVFSDATTRGTLFKLDEDGNNYVVLHAFTGSPTDGQQIQSKLLLGTDGALYGTTGFGGSGFVGTVFKLSTDGSGYTLLHNFTGHRPDGASPAGGLVEGSDGVLYGTTDTGGSSVAGTIFKLNKDGSAYAVLRSFLNTGGDGQRPYGELVEGSDGALYGTTSFGGSANYYGTIYKIGKDGSGYSVLRSFLGTGGDGDAPGTGLLLGSNGIFYGTTSFGGAGGNGCVFSLNTAPPQPQVLGLSVAGNSNVIQFTGTSGIQYDVQRSTDLASWTVLATISAPVNGSFSHTDLNPPQRAAFYQLRQH